MFGILGLGFLLGMQHALEADHLAAVSSLAARHSRVADIVRHGVTWGVGHMLTLVAFVGIALLLGRNIPEHVEGRLEAAVGIMLVLLGAHLLWRLWRDRIHAHGHRHGGVVHFHLHSHREAAGAHGRDPHQHAHGIRWRTLLVGFMHGMAGSAALLVLAATQVKSVPLALVYVVLFGLGATLGMALLSAAIALPLAASARFLTLGHRAIQGAVGVVTLAIGVATIHAAPWL